MWVYVVWIDETFLDFSLSFKRTKILALVRQNQKYIRSTSTNITHQYILNIVHINSFVLVTLDLELSFCSTLKNTNIDIKSIARIQNELHKKYLFYIEENVILIEYASWLFVCDTVKWPRKRETLYLLNFGGFVVIS